MFDGRETFKRVAARGGTAERSWARTSSAAAKECCAPRAYRWSEQPCGGNGRREAHQKAQEMPKHSSGAVSQLPRRARSQQLPQNQAQVERSHVNQLPFQNVLPAPQIAAPQATRFVAVREAAFNQLAAPPQ